MSARMRRENRLRAGVRVVERDALRAVARGLHDALGEHVEWPSKEDVVGRRLEDVDLEVHHDLAELDRDVAGQSERLVD